MCVSTCKKKKIHAQTRWVLLHTYRLFSRGRWITRCIRSKFGRVPVGNVPPLSSRSPRRNRRKITYVAVYTSTYGSRHMRARVDFFFFFYDEIHNCFLSRKTIVRAHGGPPPPVKPLPVSVRYEHGTLRVRNFTCETRLTKERDGQGTRGDRSVRGDCSGSGRRARKTSKTTGAGLCGGIDCRRSPSTPDRSNQGRSWVFSFSKSLFFPF